MVAGRAHDHMALQRFTNVHIPYLLCSMLTPDYRALVSRADVVYLSQPEVSLEGTPIGNGCVGMTVWPTSSSVRAQINRGDVFSSDRNHAGNHKNPIDYRGTCGRIDLEVGSPVFESDAYRQHLSLYDAECTIEGADLTVRCFVSSVTDLVVVEVDDRRADPKDIRLTLSTWRPSVVETPLKLVHPRIKEEIDTGTHVAHSILEKADGRLLLTQRFQETRVFREEVYDASSTVAASAIADDKCIEEAEPLLIQPVWWDEGLKPVDLPSRTEGSPQARAIVLPAATGRRTFLISSAASQEPDSDVVTDALSILDDAPSSYDALREQHVEWWHAYWSRTFVHLHSEDGLADYFERIRTLHLYYAACASRGSVPVAQIAGLNFQTDGDICQLGTQIWQWIAETAYAPLIAADAMDVTDPYFDTYVRQLPLCEAASRQRWGVESGAFYPETCPTDGPVVLPDVCAEEFRDYFLWRASAETLSTETLALCQHESHAHHITRYNRNQDEAPGWEKPFQSISHIVSTGPKIALHAWWRFRATGDEAWLRSHAYPLLKGTTELYRHLLRKDDDGCYHLYGTHVMESFYVVKDSLKDLAAIRATFPAAIRAAEILNVDDELRALWQNIVDHLAPYPLGSDPESQALGWSVLVEDAWAAAHLLELDVKRDKYPYEDVWISPIYPFATWTLETHDPEGDQIAQKTIDACPNHKDVMTGRHWRPSLVRTPMACARAGRGDELPDILAAHFGAYTPQLANGLNCFEQGVQAQGLEPSGMVTATIQDALVHAAAPAPGEPEVILLFPSWPQTWDATFRLLVSGGFLVTASVRNGQIEYVEIESRLGEQCRVRNPWNTPVTLTTGAGPERLDADVLSFETVEEGHYRLCSEGRDEAGDREVAPTDGPAPVSCAYTLPSGTILELSLGLEADAAPRGLEQFVYRNRRMRTEQAKIEKRSTAKVLG